MRTFLRILPALVFFTGCTPAIHDTTSIPLETPVIPFAPSEVFELTVRQARVGDAWVATLVRGNGGQWQIQASPVGKPLADHRADHAFVEHLLDTLRTLRASEIALEGPMASFGLEPPGLSLSWKTTRGENFQLWLGQLAGPTTFYARAPSLPGKAGETVWKAKGAALTLLSHMQDFTHLRQRKLTTLSDEEVDEVEFKNKRISFRAIRETHGNSDWVEPRKKKPFTPSASEQIHSWLRAVTHTQIREFLDNEPKQTTAPSYEVIFKDRGKELERLTLWQKGNRILASAKSRGNHAPFELHPEIMRLFSKAPAPSP